jgi:hypothetical protein
MKIEMKIEMKNRNVMKIQFILETQKNINQNTGYYLLFIICYLLFVHLLYYLI